MKKILLSFAILMAAVGAWAGDVQLQDADGTKFVNMPYQGTDNLTLTDASVMAFKVYDDGGAEERYRSSSDGYLLITVPEGYVLQLTGTVQTETSYDYLTVYDGTTNAAAVLRENLCSLPSSGDLTDIGSIISTGSSILLYFHSDGGSNYEGLNLDVTLFKPNEAYSININETTGGVIHSSKATAKYNEEITLTWTHETGYVLESISITDAYGRPVSFTGGSWYNVATHFTMPTSAVTVTPTFIKATTSVDGLFINFPETGQTKTCDIATGVTSFKVYDDGGAEGEYSNDYRGYVIITAPEGLRMQLTGTISGESADNLTVYDGKTDEAAVLLDHVYGNGHNDPAKDIGIITTTGNSMMLYFQTDGSLIDPGLDLEVTLFNPNEAFPINISTVTGGSMTSDKPTAKFTETVALTESHEDGYVLKDILVKDVNNRTVEVNGGTWYRVDASFTMPASEVTVTPTFIPATTIADGLFINMLREGTITTNISTGVKSFKVYDDGGAEGEYSDGCNSCLVLNVPEGYQIQVTGTIDSENCDYLTFYDGDDDQAPTLREQVTSIDSHNLSDIGIVTSSGRSMTIRFYSDGSQYDDGYALNVYVFNPNEPQPITINPATGGAMASNVPSAKFNEVITLTETHERGYTLEKTTAVDANGMPVAINGGTWYNAAASFIMPIAGVTVTPQFTTARTAEDGLFINMPKEGTLTTDICNGIKSFKVYDDGGAEENYSDGCDGYLMLQAPIGYRLKVTGTVASENGYDYLYIYDGTEVDEAKCLLEKFSSPNENNKQPTDIGEYGSTARTLLLYFRSDSSQGADGLDLTVELIPITYTLAFDNGQAGATGTMAITGSMESITLTYDTPQNLPAMGFSRTAYNFLGWSTAVDGDVAFADKAEVENLATEQDAVVTIYGKWQPIVYPITYDLAGGSVATANPTEYNVETATFTLTNPTQEGYNFIGWTGTDLTEPTETVTIAQGSMGDREYTATWEVAYILGDINGDGTVDVSDYIGVANHIMGLPLVDFNEMAGDVDANGIIDVSDYIGVANIILTGNVNGTQQSRATRHENQRKVAADTDLSAYDNVIYVAPQTVTAGEQVTLSICMNNTAAIRGFQFDLYLPTGVTLMKNNKNRYIYSFNQDRLDDGDEHTLTLGEQPDGAIRFLCGTQYDEWFLGNDGEIATMKVTIAADMAAGDYPIILKNMKLTETDISKFYEAAEVQTTLTVTTTTGINAQWASLIGKPVYDLRGLKVADEFNPKRLPAGVYIVEGRKVVVKK